MSEEIINKPKIKVWGGVLFLFIYTGIIGFVCKEYVSGDTYLSDGIVLASIASMIVYAITARLFHFDRKKKLISLALLFIVLNIGGIYLGIYNYQHSAKMAEVARVVKGFSLLKTQEKQQEATELRKNIAALAESIQAIPKNIEQAKKHIAVIDQLLPLYKRSYDLTKQIMEQVLELISSVKNVQDMKKVEEVVWINGKLNVSALAPYLKQLDKWYGALTANLNARKEYYESFINNESSQTQTYLLHKWTTLEDTYLQEESQLVRLQSELKSQPNSVAQR
jgi:hypothetical protein